jgi:4-amino-4-deoxy-L-arabinose transferase-like glycosyltransferase
MKNLRSKKIYFVLLSLIFLLALFLRIDTLDKYPVGFHIDEASLGYNGYSLRLTGKDDNGKPFPLYIDMFGDNRPSGYHYLTIPSIMVFGLNEFATRLPAALFGSFSVFAFSFLLSALFRSRKISLLGALLLALAPWHIVLSRASGEAIVALFFILFGFGLIIDSIENQLSRRLLIGTIIASLSFFFYHTPRVFVPLFFLSLFTGLYILKKNTLDRKYQITIVLSFLFLSIVVFLLIFLTPGGTGRFNQINIFSSFETNFQLQQQASEDQLGGGNHLVSRVLHNKVTNLGVIFVGHYLAYFSGTFLFVSGGLPIWYNVPRMGLLLFIELPFLLIGLINLIKSKNYLHKIPLLWILVAPIVASITYDDIPNINRATVLFPMFHLAAAFGFMVFFQSLQKRKKRILIIVSSFLLFANTAYFLQQYFVVAKAHNPWYRNNGFSEMMEVVKKEYGNYDKIVISKYQGGIYPLVLFYLQYNPRSYQDEGSQKSTDYKGFGKIVFAPQDCPSVQSSDKIKRLPRMLFVDKGECPISKMLARRKILFIYRTDNSKAFRIVYE